MTLLDDSSKRTMSTEIAALLGKDIAEGHYQPGSKLRESEIADRFESSRGPVREALRLLAQEGVVDLRPRHGAFVTKLTPEELWEIDDIRGALFSTAVRLYTQRVSSGAVGREVLAELSQCVKNVGNLAQDADVPEQTFGQATQTVGRHIFTHCGNQRLAKEVSRLNRQSLWYYVRITHSKHEHRKRINSLGSIMVAAVHAGEEEIAADAARKMVEANQRELFHHLNEADETGPLLKAVT